MPSAVAIPVVGIGASAGGLEAFEEFFRACPADSGLAFVLVPHLDPGHESLLTEILQRSTAMPVAQAEDQVRVAPNPVYIIPPNREMSLLHGALQLSAPEQAHGRRMPIDAFLRSLAEDQGEKAIGIILSGTATDGTLGLRAILSAGGVCMVQEPSTAKYEGMPKSAIAAGYVTHVLPVEQMPAMLVELTRQSAYRLKVPAFAAEKGGAYNAVLLQLRSATGHDFSLYKKSTIGRRIERRMARHDITEAAVYARYLKENPAEARALFKELLINVTSFFRDPDAFTALEETVLPALMAGRPSGHVFRVWVAGCATGEEAYSIAIVLLELQDELRARHEEELTLQIYATDLDDDAIAVARAGHYSPNIVQDVTPERLRRFFVKDETGFKVKKEVRDRIVFAVQNVVKDPPFTRLDLLSCRNLMIYLEPELQDRLVSSFHYALQPGGVLFLSASESVSEHPELFTALDRKWKFYAARKTTTRTRAPAIPPAAVQAPSRSEPALVQPRAASADKIAALSHRALLQAFAPPSVTTDARGDILYIHGDTSKYLRTPPGPVTHNVVDMAREGLQQALRIAILAASSRGVPTLAREVSLETANGVTAATLSVRLLPGLPAAPASSAGDGLLLVSFQDVPVAAMGRGKRAAASAGTGRVRELERALAYAGEHMKANLEEQQATNEELKSANEELQSTNEELQSTNEELQSTNEELETSKEELQSLNEETITVNAELNAKVEQLSLAQNDMKNLLDSTNTGTLFLDNQLVLRR